MMQTTWVGRRRSVPGLRATLGSDLHRVTARIIDLNSPDHVYVEGTSNMYTPTAVFATVVGSSQLALFF